MVTSTAYRNGTQAAPFLNDRVARLKDQAMNATPRLCAERAALYTDAWFTSMALPVVLRRAAALAAVLHGMTVFITEDELLVGNQASAIRSAPIFPEYTVGWLEQELDSLPDRTADPFAVSAEVRQTIHDIIPRWKGHTLEDRVLATVHPEVMAGWKEARVFNLAVLCSSGPAHLVVDYPTVLAEGLSGLMVRAKEVLSQLDFASPEGFAVQPFLQSVPVVCQAAIDFAGRYATLARNMARAEKRAERAAELLEIADICQYVPAHPARTFREALQSVWFVQLILQIESSGHSVSLGRLDQYLYPYYAADLAAGRITPEKARELLACLWIKLFWVNKVRPWSATQYAAGYPTYQNVTIGGQTPAGQDATNELTYLCLESMDATRLPTPNLSARYHSASPEKYLTACAETISHGFGMPALEDDEAIVPSLASRGASQEDALNYAMVGCVEAAVPGKWGYRCNGMTFTNLMKVLEIALYGGQEPVTGACLLPGKGDLSTFGSFEEALAEWRRQLAYYTRLVVAGDTAVDAALEELAPDPFCSVLVQDCISRGKTLNEGGAIYDIISGSQQGIANVANSLAAIRRLVFDDRQISGAELLQAMRTNYAGPGGEAIRQLLLTRGPKWGTDDDYVDCLAVSAYNDFITQVEKYHNRRWGRGPIGGGYYSSTSTVSSNVPAGAIIGATPDGRRAGDSLAEGSSPHPGTDILGPTAAIRSVAKMPTLKITGGQLLNLKFAPAEVQGEKLPRLVSLIRSFAELQGWHVQFNVISAETLRAAQERPEEYRSLMVRVAGYCALFTTLDRSTQDNIIRRTEHRWDHPSGSA